MIYHSGELAVQARVGVQAEAENLAKGIGSAIIKPAAKDFLASQRLAIASTIGSVLDLLKRSLEMVDNS